MHPSDRQGAVAAGSPATAEAARHILAAGGNAFDAAVAGCFAACVAEPMLASLGGGGFLLARESAGRSSVYDFFAQTPLRKRRGAELYPIECDFGDALQVFHIGIGSVATPGLVKGLFRVHRDLCTMPVARLVEPAVELARSGVRIDPIRGFVQRLLRPILIATPEAARLFLGEESAPGRRWRAPELAAVMEALAAEGEELFYHGDLARSLTTACAAGGHLTATDLQRYRVIRRAPFAWRYRGHRLMSNPSPSTGGTLIAFALKVLEGQRPVGGYGSAGHLEPLFHAMALTNEARAAPIRHRGSRRRPMLHSRFLSPYRRALRRRLARARGTTHLSVADGSGNLASLSVSNGEGCGVVLPGTGIMLNNMLGEDDLHPEGLDRWPEGRRLASMMAPTLVEHRDGRLVALGSGGSNRLRTAILQVLVNLLDLELPLEQAVSSPRIHFEGDRLDLEPGIPAETVAMLCRHAGRSRVWESLNLFFGGVHAVELDLRRRTMAGAGDPRRGGVVRTTEA